ncbi:flavin reductase family protein [Mucilaginibacter sp. UR6-11]|uniref:flavin reductase family protein n=1 Tax=Mucilaginibacter sp. UR6-11 TaxID=1435644 RepID=UPI001E2FEDDA|nr:flavin reductase family protein [Mucilaginibacter sp. UR6-11]MCC8426325.1 flavin reductase family protein [Mucilaginibacter sp. UR6-11]
MKSFEASELTIGQVHNYLQHAIAPRPIALVSTIDRAGKVNLSPFSFFNLFSANPPVIIFSPSRRVKDNTTKHTLENLYEVRECVVNIVDYNLVFKVNQASAEYEKGVNEFIEAGLTELASIHIKPPRVAESPVQLECTVQHIMPLGKGPGAGNLVIAEVKTMHFRDDLLDELGKPMQEKFDQVARLGGDWYCRTTDLFKLPKPI